MSKIFLFFSTAIIIAFTSVSPAVARISAAEVWSGWQSLLQGPNTEITFEEAASDGILTINDLKITVHGKSEPVVYSLGALVLMERNDGSVEVILPPEAPLSITSGKDFSAVFQQTKIGYSFVISGTENDLIYDFKAEQIVLSLQELRMFAKQIKSPVLEITLKNVIGSANSRTGELFHFSKDFSVGELAYNINIKSSDIDQTVISLKGAITNLAGHGKVIIPEHGPETDLSEFMKAGAQFSATLSYAGLNTDFFVSEQQNPISGTLESANGSFSLNAEAGETSVLDIQQNLSVDTISLSAKADSANKNNQADSSFQIAGITEGIRFSLPDDFDNKDLTEALMAGLIMAMKIDVGSLDGKFLLTNYDQTSSGSVSIGAAKYYVTMDKSKIHFGGGIKDQNTEIISPEMPFGPLKYSFAEVAVDWLMPATISREASDFSLIYKIVDLSVSDNLWELFDKEGSLPRAPATVILDIAGKGKWLVDIFNDGLKPENPVTPKGELEFVELRKLYASVAGAELTGNGAFTFDNDDLTTFDGIPAPTGGLKLKLTGGNTLLDKLVALGLVPENSAMGIRMGLSLFTVTGEGDDTLVSDIEVKPDGKILANGKRIK